MRTTVTLDDDQLAKAKRLTNIGSTQKLLGYAIERMAAYEAIKHLVSLAGTEPGLKLTPRRRLEVKK